MKLRMSGVIPPLPLYASGARTWTVYHLTLKLDKTYSFKFSKDILGVLKLLEPEVYVSSESRLVVRPTPPLVEWVPRVLSSVVK